MLAADFEPPEALRGRLSPVLAAGLYDTAIREMSVALEMFRIAELYTAVVSLATPAPPDGACEGPSAP
ncbi:MAG: hypothetical protein ACRDLN_07080 [Solirubrobacteraceae bacterium]